MDPDRQGEGKRGPRAADAAAVLGQVRPSDLAEPACDACPGGRANRQELERNGRRLNSEGTEGNGLITLAIDDSWQIRGHRRSSAARMLRHILPKPASATENLRSRRS